MTTSDPQADRRSDDPGEHRSIGQRIRDAVLGDPEDDRRDAPGQAERRDDAYADPRTGSDPGAAEAGYADAPGGPAGGAESGAPGYTESGHRAQEGAGGYVATDAGAGHSDVDRGYVDRTGADPTGTDPTDTDHGYVDRTGTDRADTDRGYAGSADSDHGAADPGYVDRGDADRGYAANADTDRGYAADADTDRGYTANADTGREYAPYEQAMQEHAQGGAVPDPVRDDVTQDGVERPTGDRGGYADRDVPAAPNTGQAGYDDRDLVTSSYDPDRDSGYDPQAAGTAATGGGAAGATAVGQDEPRYHDTRSDDVRGGQAYDTRDYDPATDTGYLDEGRADADRATAPRDADYDTGRVDTGDRDTGHAAGLGAAGAVAAGAAGVAAARHGRDERSDARFDEVDDTTTVEPTSTQRATPDTAGTAADFGPGTNAGATAGTTGDTAGGDTAADRRAEAVADEADDDSHGDRERLVPADRAHDYSSRWDALKGDFVDEPRRAVTQADQLVGEVLDDIQRLFSDQRRELDEGFDRDQASTEDLRLALRRYRSFFDRLLSL